MDTWPAFVHAVLDRHGVADLPLVDRFGISADRYYRRTAREGWSRAGNGIRVHPSAPPSVQRQLLIACSRGRRAAAASGLTAAWLHGLQDRPPARPTVLAPHASRWRVDDLGVHLHRARWFGARDIVMVDEVPTVAPSALPLTLQVTTVDQLQALVIDLVHRRHADASEMLATVERAGPDVGRSTLRSVIADIADRRVESVFQADVVEVLDRLGYAPTRSTRRIATPDGRSVVGDIALEAWRVLIEPEGDRYHRTREQRRLDRRRLAALAATDWAVVPVDWRDWHLERNDVLDAIDLAIARQRRAGIGTHTPVPDRSRVPPVGSSGSRLRG